MFRDKVQEKTTLVGAGAYSVGSASNIVPGWKTWRSQFANGAQVVTWAVNDDESIWEKTYGTFTYGPPDTISRTYLLSSTGALIDWQSTDVVYLYSAPISEALEGRYDTPANMFVPSGRKPYTAVGAGNKAVATADAGARFSLDNSAAPRTVTLPAISGVSIGFNVEVFGLSQVNYLNIAPTGSDVIDYGSAGQTLPLPGKVPVLIWSDGTQWRTSFDYSYYHCMGIASPSGASSVDFTGLPYWARNVKLRWRIIASSSGAQPALRKSASGVFDTGNNYAHLFFGFDSTPTSSTGTNSAQSMAFVTHTGLGNGANNWLRGETEFFDIGQAGNVYARSRLYGFNNTGLAFDTEVFNWMTTSIDGIRVLMSAGNFSGTLWLDCTG
jgi:hypothetical protein